MPESHCDSVQVGPSSLNLLKGEEHLKMKRLLGEAFSEQAVVALLAELETCTQNFCQRCACFNLGEFAPSLRSSLPHQSGQNTYEILQPSPV